MESIAHKFKDLGLKSIKISEEIPEFNICISPTLDEKLISKLKDALISLSDSKPEDAEILKSINESYTGMIEASDKEYNNVRVMMSNIGLI